MKKIITLVIMFMFVNIFFISEVKAEDKTYDKYSVGDEVTIKNEKYYVITDSPKEQDYVTVLKGEPLLYSKMKELLPQTGIEDKITSSTAFNNLDTTQLDCAFIYSDTCNSDNHSGCTSSYSDSSVKKVVDVWATNKLSNQLKTVDGYSARLITLDELIALGYHKMYGSGDNQIYYKGDNTPNWLYGNYWYWTMTPYENLNWKVFSIAATLGDLSLHEVDATEKVRPVINVYKDRINDADDTSKNTNNGESASNNDKSANITSEKVKVEDTLAKIPLILGIISVILIIVGGTITTFTLLKKSKQK